MIYECFHIFILLFTTLYIGLFITDIPVIIKDILTNTFARIIILFLFFYKRKYDIFSSLVISISLVLIVPILLHHFN